MSDEDNLSELSEAARRAGYIVTEQIDAIIEKAEQQAEAIRREAERDAEDMRRAALESAQRLLARLEALEFPLGSLVASLRDEAEHVSRQLEPGARSVDTQGTALPSAPEEAHSVVEDADARPPGATEDEVGTDAPQPLDEGPDDGQETAEHDFEEAHGEAFDGPAPEPSERPSQTAGDWKRWIIEDDEDEGNPLEEGERPASAIGSPRAPSHEGAGQPADGAGRSRGRRRAKPRS